jgi:hypothetical protein
MLGALAKCGKPPSAIDLRGAPLDSAVPDAKDLRCASDRRCDEFEKLSTNEEMKDEDRALQA